MTSAVLLPYGAHSRYLVFCLGFWHILQLLRWFIGRVYWICGSRNHVLSVLPYICCLQTTKADLFCSSVQFSSVQLLSPVRLFATAACQALLSITNSWSLLKLVSIESVMPSNHPIFCRPLLLPPSIFPSIWVFSNESVLCIRWPEYWSFSFSISPTNEYSGLISSRMDWLGLLAVQGTLNSPLQHHSSKASILWCSAFFI